MAWLLDPKSVLLLVLVAGVATVMSAPAASTVITPRIVKCNNKTLTACYKKQFTCPSDCPDHCMADCYSCQAVCRPNKVRCQYKKAFPQCGQQTLRCPDTCPTSCHVDCVSCQPICGPAPPPPPPPTPKTPRTPPSPRPPPPTQYYPPPPPTNSPPPPSAPTLRVSCRNQTWPQCYGMVFNCPTACPNRCGVDCITCKPVCDCNRPGAVCEDPRFIGADGITFYFHGKKDKDFCLVTDSNLHINAHFIGRRNDDMGRDFTWVQSLGVLFDNHKLFIGAQMTAAWDDATDRLALSLDDQMIVIQEEEDASWTSKDGSITIKRTRDTNSVKIQSKGNFEIKASVVPITEKESRVHNYGINTQENCFAHLDLNFKFYSLAGDVNGVLGQTYAMNYVSRAKMGIEMPVLGGDKEFASSGLFATDCSVARFHGQSRNEEMNYELGDLSCGSGLDGRGVVCKR